MADCPEAGQIAGFVPGSSTMRALSLCLVSTIALTSPCLAASQPIPDALQQEAMTCVGEAMQICPDVMTSEDHGMACMTGKRGFFSPRCRIVYDKVARTLRAK
jgi:hypothetical protein